jgi:hypothetical protein
MATTTSTIGRIHEMYSRIRSVLLSVADDVDVALKLTIAELVYGSWTIGGEACND